jgi:hypothetical protein
MSLPIRRVGSAWRPLWHSDGAQSMRCGADADIQRLDGQREDSHVPHPWAMVRRRGKVLVLEMDQGRWAMSRRKLTGVVTVRWLSSVEGKAPRGQGATLGHDGAPGPTRKDGGAVSGSAHGE